MSTVMSYLLQISDEFRESYEMIDKRVTEVLDMMNLVEVRLREVEQRLNQNLRDDAKS